MKLQFLGGAQTVTGSRYLVSDGKSKILVDCGLFQGFKHYRERNWAPFPVPPVEIEAVILTHAHVDHSGYIPVLIKNGFKGTIYCTHATFDLCKILLPDSGFLQEEEAGYANKKKFSKHTPALALYTEQEARQALNYFQPIEWNTLYRLKNGMDFKFSPAGHILGAASVLIKANGNSIFFSGDVGRPHDPLMRAPNPPLVADMTIVESTYGNRVHPTPDPIEEMAAVIARTIGRGGTLVIPAFAVGRAQLLLYDIFRLKKAKKINVGIPVYLNSPMATSVNEVFEKYCDELRISKADAKAVCETAKIVKTQADSIAINASIEAKILIAGSGMATGGRVLHHLKAFGGDAKNTLLFAGFQAGGTRGDSIVRGAKEVKIHGEFWPIRAEVVQMDTMSAHADSLEILAWLGQSPCPRKILVTHGEPDASRALSEQIQKQFGCEVRAPELMEVVEL